MNLNLPKEATYKGPAAIWKRVLAFIIDLMILDFVVGTPLQGSLLSLIPTSDFSQTFAYLESHPKAALAASLILLFYGLCALLYFSILEYKKGQTVGKMVLNIKVESEQKERKYFSYVLRSMYFAFVFPFIFFWVIDPIFMMFDKEGRRLSERFSRTRTVEQFLLR